jgi:mono/diheme cytochrome c family protein
MKRFKSVKRWLRAGGGLAAAAAIVCAASLVGAAGADTNAPPAKAAGTKAKDSTPAAKPAKKLTGADLYAVHCNRCHPERYATEFTATQWKTILTHMRVRANLPASQAKLILRYLQEDAGN